MDILKTSIDWARAEMLSSSFFILFGLVFLVACFGFWHIGKTDVARAFVIPTLVAGVLILIIGIGIFVQSQGRVTSFAVAFDSDAAAFVSAEIARAERVMGDYQIAVFRVIPAIVALCAILIPFVETPIWRASLITTIAMMAVIMVIDTNAHARLDDYRTKLQAVQ